MAAGGYGGRYQVSATPVIVLAQLFGVAALTLMLVWLLHFRNGISLSTSNLGRLLDAHHLFMLCGPIICAGQGIMAYKAFPGTRRARKIIHTLLHVLGMVFAVIGLYAIFKLYSVSGVPNMHSLHSWTGLGAICLYVLQFWIGFTCFLFPGAAAATRADVKPWHAFFGLVIFALIICTSATGLIQRFRFLGLLRGKEALVLNFTGVAIILFGIAVVLVAILP
ncbi:putative ascorbate-specific transmembrane electron transporter 1 [Apostasia shenzhenica]|uniref:Putative ascorbate-specific transmembrane electron transporter 1 n=1 Tax=Apostasia shenzhenica TaxID=1088818 RepID=A0A2I0A9F8_9ASPA|nr:putative ascorbate-specific transmembrane electron transporter 1 [Apostasia shenzhenica]